MDVSLRMATIAMAYLVRFTTVSSAYVRVRREHTTRMIKAPHISIPVASLNKKSGQKARENANILSAEHYSRAIYTGRN